jgi:hypothetical protein
VHLNRPNDFAIALSRLEDQQTMLVFGEPRQADHMTTRAAGLIIPGVRDLRILASILERIFCGPCQWEALAQAARIQVKQQQEFCLWWKDEVSTNWGGDRSKSRDLRTWGYREAEKLTGISNQQVCDWRKLLTDVDRYLARIELAARRTAGQEPTGRRSIRQPNLWCDARVVGLTDHGEDYGEPHKTRTS